MVAFQFIRKFVNSPNHGATFTKFSFFTTIPCFKVIIIINLISPKALIVNFNSNLRNSFISCRSNRPIILIKFIPVFKNIIAIIFLNDSPIFSRFSVNKADFIWSVSNRFNLCSTDIITTATIRSRHANTTLKWLILIGYFFSKRISNCIKFPRHWDGITIPICRLPPMVFRIPNANGACNCSHMSLIRIPNSIAESIFSTVSSFDSPRPTFHIRRINYWGSFNNLQK